MRFILLLIVSLVTCVTVHGQLIYHPFDTVKTENIYSVIEEELNFIHYVNLHDYEYISLIDLNDANKKYKIKLSVKSNTKEALLKINYKIPGVYSFNYITNSRIFDQGYFMFIYSNKIMLYRVTPYNISNSGKLLEDEIDKFTGSSNLSEIEVKHLKEKMLKETLKYACGQCSTAIK